MGRFKLDRAGVNKIRKMLRHQVTEVQKSFAVEAFSYFMNFGYHVDGGGPEDGGGGWSLYYLANWNCKVDGIDTSVLSPERYWGARQSEYISRVDPRKIFSEVSRLSCGKSISVTNSVWYGPILNEGGQHPAFFAGGSLPNRFIEKCHLHLAETAHNLISDVEKDCPEL